MSDTLRSRGGRWIVRKIARREDVAIFESLVLDTLSPILVFSSRIHRDREESSL